MNVTSVPRLAAPFSTGAGPTTFKRRHRVAVGEFDVVFEPVAPDRQLQHGRQRVDHRDADAVQAAGHLVGVLVEFPAGVQLGHDDLGRRDLLLLVDAGRHAATVVGDGAGAVGVQRHRDQLGVAGERLVDGVVDDLVNHVMQARAVVGVADIHARAFAHGVETAQNLDRIGVIGIGSRLNVRQALRLSAGIGDRARANSR